MYAFFKKTFKYACLHNKALKNIGPSVLSSVTRQKFDVRTNKLERSHEQIRPFWNNKFCCFQGGDDLSSQHLLWISDFIQAYSTPTFL